MASIGTPILEKRLKNARKARCLLLTNSGENALTEVEDDNQIVDKQEINSR